MNEIPIQKFADPRIGNLTPSDAAVLHLLAGEIGAGDCMPSWMAKEIDEKVGEIMNPVVRSMKIAALFGGIDELVFLGFRYYLGRMTIQTCAFAEKLAVVYPELDRGIQSLIRKELDQAFEHNDLGHDCDREAWEKVRAAYTPNQ